MIRVITSTNNKMKNAGPKAKEDVIKIISKLYDNNVKIDTLYQDTSKKILKPIFILKKFWLIFKNFFNRDIILFQYPLSNTFNLLELLPKKRTIVLIHDLQGLRENNQKKEKSEIKQLKKFNYVIVHNDKMFKYLKTKGLKDECMFKLELFDYIVDNEIYNDNYDDSIAFVGNLSDEKSPFIKQLDYKKMKYKLNLYGVGINSDINSKIKYSGSFKPDVLPNKINSKLGLVWDGNFDESDENKSYKNYMKYNNPHKLSCYIATGIPVIVWNKSAIADFVKKNDIGYTISDLYEINNLDFSTYDKKMENVKKISYKVRNGIYLQEVLNNIIKKMEK